MVKTAFNGKQILRGFVLVGAALLATSAFAANKGTFELKRPTQVAGHELAAGTYKVQWDGSGSEVQLSIMQGNKQVASTNARVLQVPVAPQGDSALITMNPDGSRTLAQLRFRGKAIALELKNEGGGEAGASSSGQ